ncbi:MAG: transcription elongation factor GreA [Zetaproteobacteria bacterium]|nr:MAG: transcription elongation factor GreA [Zetaproteobacteria bacterium]
MERIPMTKAGFERLKKELEELKAKRREIARAIEEARAHGDLSENAEYEAAKEAQGLNEARIQYLEDRLARAHVIDPKTITSDRVVFGATVDLIDLEDGTEVSYQIVGVDEADASEGRISITSPLARALIGKEEGDIVTVQAPGGEREYEIQRIRYE